MAGNLSVLHVIERLAPGGAANALISTARELAATGQKHRVLSLEPAIAASAQAASASGLDIVERDQASTVLAEADLVLVHTWNSPSLDAFLRENHPPARCLFWLHVAGDTAPHRLNACLSTFPDILIASSPYSTRLPEFETTTCLTDCVLASTDLAPFLAVKRIPGEQTVRIGFVGSLDATKLHPDFVGLHHRVAAPDAEFAIYGEGSESKRLEGEVAMLGDTRFGLHGWAGDVPAALSTFDIFGYPLPMPCHATAEIALQEAMAAGVPPVIMRHGSAPDLVQHEQTGLIANDAADYSAQLERLIGDAELRRRLGESARAFAKANFGADRAATELGALFERASKLPKRTRNWGEGELAGSERFLASLGSAAGPFAESMATTAPAAADNDIMHSSPALASATSGGVLHWRRHYPDDAWLRFWSGLVLLGQGRCVPAMGEFLRAREMGIASERIEPFLAAAKDRQAAPPAP